MHNDEQGFPGGTSGKEPTCQNRGWEDPLEEGMATQSGNVAWRIPWTEEPLGSSPEGRKESDTPEET